MKKRKLRLTAAILAGGKSRRMGADKASLEWQGQTLLGRVAATCLAAGLDVVVVGRERPDDWTIEGVSFVCDEIPDQGPLGGLLTAISVLKTDRDGILALACDMPLVDCAAIDWLIERAQSTEDGIESVVARTRDGRIQPLFGIYLRSCATRIRGRIDSGQRSMSGMIADARVAVVDAPATISAALVNANTAEEFSSLAAMIGDPFHDQGKDP